VNLVLELQIERFFITNLIAIVIGLLLFVNLSLCVPACKRLMNSIKRKCKNVVNQLN
jgi:hypothetical protein